MSEALRILVVEDDDRLVVYFYQPLGTHFLSDVRFSFAENGEKALALLETNLFDVLLLDLDLTKGGRLMTGRQVLAWVARNRPKLPVVVITGTRTQGIRKDVSGKTFEGFRVREVIGKPVSIVELEALLEILRLEVGNGP
jgi:CheY-like chemotaxis protein